MYGAPHAARPQTIQIFLPYGEARGVRQAEITSRTVRMFDVPRTQLSKFADFPESEQPGVYFLFGQNPDGRDMCYIGQSDNVRKRISEHDSPRKEFWTRAVIAVSLTNTWTKAHIHYLEFQAIKLARAAGSYLDDNMQAGHSTQIPAPMRADCEEFFDTIQVLISTLGYRVMEEPMTLPDVAERHSALLAALVPADTTPAVVVLSDIASPVDRKFHIRKAGIDASATYRNQRITVLAGSTARPGSPDKAHHKLPMIHQNRLVVEGILFLRGDRLVFRKDCEFETPSAASLVVMGAPTNGWSEWVDDGGISMSVAERGDQKLTRPRKVAADTMAEGL